MGMPVQDVMLNTEYDVKEDGYVAEQELDWISRNARPVRLERRINH